MDGFQLTAEEEAQTAIEVQRIARLTSRSNRRLLRETEFRIRKAVPRLGACG